MDQVNILPLNTFRGKDDNLVLSWEFLANQNRPFYMQLLANFTKLSAGVEDLNLVYLGEGGGEILT